MPTRQLSKVWAVSRLTQVVKSKRTPRNGTKHHQPGTVSGSSHQSRSSRSKGSHGIQPATRALPALRPPRRERAPEGARTRLPTVTLNRLPARGKRKHRFPWGKMSTSVCQGYSVRVPSAMAGKKHLVLLGKRMQKAPAAARLPLAGKSGDGSTPHRPPALHSACAQHRAGGSTNAVHQAGTACMRMASGRRQEGPRTAEGETRRAAMAGPAWRRWPERGGNALERTN